MTDLTLVLPEAVAQHGHEVEYDPPAAITKVRRWTCKRGCGHAVLWNGFFYGSALDTPCSKEQPT